MNREIKFRGFHKKKKIMIPDIHMIYDEEFGDCFGMMDEEIVKMQYTGLKDKNGKEIYEGDILSYDRKDKEFKDWPKNEPFPIGVVIWFENEAGFGWCQIDWGVESIVSHHIVIGNVHENPELLKTVI